jgi:hypothetical protein
MSQSNVAEFSVLPSSVVELMVADVSKHWCPFFRIKQSKKMVTNSASRKESRISLSFLQLPAIGHKSD